MIEIEKRYKLLKQPPEQSIINKFTIQQYYIQETNPKIRIRKSFDLNDTWYSHCCKYSISGNSIAREEIESVITENQFARICESLNIKENDFEQKQRTIVKLDDNDFCMGLQAEIDKYDNSDVVVEVEFYNMEQANNFTPPDWFGNEIEKFSKLKSLWSGTK